MDTFIAILVAVLGGGGFSGLLSFWINRMDTKKHRDTEVLDAIHRLTEKVDALEDKLDEQNAVACRIRILRFYDEMRSGIRHTKDSWDQCLSDITTYDLYCGSHTGFKNNQTAATVGYINSEYGERLVRNDFE